MLVFLFQCNCNREIKIKSDKDISSRPIIHLERRTHVDRGQVVAKLLFYRTTWYLEIQEVDGKLIDKKKKDPALVLTTSG